MLVDELIEVLVELKVVVDRVVVVMVVEEIEVELVSVVVGPKYVVLDVVRLEELVEELELDVNVVVVAQDRTPWLKAHSLVTSSSAVVLFFKPKPQKPQIPPQLAEQVWLSSHETDPNASKPTAFSRYAS